jgi:probable phosphoglycerate mutase
LLIRHAAHGHIGTTLSGRSEGLPLTADGRRQAQRLARLLASRPADAVHSSPVQRARETAAAIAGECGREVEAVEALDEIDFGDWTGRRFAELAGDPAWTRWNTMRSQATPPGGESMAAAQRRALRHLRETARRFTDGTVAMVTHCDIIRAIVAAVLGLSLDQILRFDCDPASVSRIAIGDWGEKVLTLNEGTA